MAASVPFSPRCFKNPYHDNPEMLEALTKELEADPQSITLELLSRSIVILLEARQHVHSILSTIIDRGKPYITATEVRQLGVTLYAGSLPGLGFALMRLGQTLETLGPVVLEQDTADAFVRLVHPSSFVPFDAEPSVVPVRKGEVPLRILNVEAPTFVATHDDIMRSPVLYACAAAQKALSLCMKIQDASQSAARSMMYPTMTFLCGHVGVHAVAASMIDACNKTQVPPGYSQWPLSYDVVSQRLAYFLQCQIIMEDDDYDEDELLYGRAGVLYTLLFLFTNLKNMPLNIDKDLVLRYCTTLLDRGTFFASEEQAEWPLFYVWHGKPYLGAAHGISGILHVLHLALPHIPETSPVHQRIRQTLASSAPHFLSRRIPRTGNFSTRMAGSQVDREESQLYQWCHGAPGVIPTLIDILSINRTNPDEDVTESLHDALYATWRKGILRKGLGLCHGIGGNGYAFLFAWKGFRAWRRRETVEQPRDHEILTLVRAVAFARSGMRHFETLLNVPDHPWSLFEGVLGFACYLMDVGLVVDGKEGMGFPGYDLS